MISSQARVEDLLRHVSYKPNWKIVVKEFPSSYSPYPCFALVVRYPGYDTENAAFDPVGMENEQTHNVRIRLSRSNGQQWPPTLGRYQWVRSFSDYDVEHMGDDDIIRVIIAGTIKEAEMFEFDRWFQFDQSPIFERRESARK